ncbi:translocase [Pseudoroseicyclus sp. CXY001]|uniref:translocase n=1 Tax=Pseudoroseicyclus sp. CXY001 TaxID=3242492 RepID=UPI003570A763
MKSLRKITIAFATFAAALAIGFVMQNDDALAARIGSEGPATPAPATDPVAAPVPEPVAARAAEPLPALEADPQPRLVSAPQTPEATVPLADAAAPLLIAGALPETALPRLPAGADAPALAPPGPLLIAALGAAPAGAALLAQPSCDSALTATALPGALVALDLHAPCAANRGVTIHHRGMIFTALTDAAGRLDVTVPALSGEAAFIAEIAGGESLSATADVPDIGAYDRAVLQWEGTTGVELHALEYGAGYDDAGHVWWGAPGAAEAALTGAGGYMTELGTETPEHAYFAEIYTFPTAAAMPGEVALSVEAVITPDNCGQPVAAQSLQLRPGAQPRAVDLTVTLPDCNSLGEYLVLSNMLEDLTLAAP